MSRKIQKEMAIAEKISKDPRSLERKILRQPAKKGAFLVRQFGNPQGPLLDSNGKSTILALSALDCGEPVPKNEAAARKLANKGNKILEEIRQRNKKNKTDKKK